MRLSLVNVATQPQVLKRLAEMAEKASLHPLVREVAIALTSDCAARDDECELEQIYNAVKYGDDRVPALKKGIRYVADPTSADYFTAPNRLLELAARGANGGDCDDHACLVAALCAALGFKVGLRAWGKKGQDFEHVYAVVGVSKRRPTKVLGMDTTVPDAYVGWEPPGGHVLTAWIMEGA